MCKLVLKVFFMVLLSVASVYAKDNVNIYEKPRKAPAQAVIHESGKNYRLSDFKGEFVVAIFWSRDCGPCIGELKSLNGFYNATKGKGVRLLLISPNEQWSSIAEQKRFLKRYGAPDVDFYVDEKGMVASDLGIFTSPHTVLINEKGEEIGRIRGSAKWDRDDVIEYIYQLKEKYG